MVYVRDLDALLDRVQDLKLTITTIATWADSPDPDEAIAHIQELCSEALLPR